MDTSIVDKEPAKKKNTRPYLSPGRVIVYNQDVWTSPIVERGEIDTSIRETESQFIIDGRADMGDVIKQVYDTVNKRYGTDYQAEFGGDND